MDTHHMVVVVMPWIAQFCYFSAVLPQLFLNYKLKTTVGLSKWYFIGYLNGYFAYTFYSFCLDLPVAYKLMVPLTTLVILLIIFQFFIYADPKKKMGKFKISFFVNILIVFLIIPFAFKYPHFIGNFTGWIMVSCLMFYQIPQIIKVFRNKSVVDFSFFLVSFIALGRVMEFIAAIILKLPFQTVFNCLRGFLFYLLFCFQFWLYTEWKKKK